jgi:membrane protease YdiL (CAAX protease family)
MPKAVSGAIQWFVYGRQTDRIRASWRIFFPLLIATVALFGFGGLATALEVNRGTMMLISFSGTTVVTTGLLLIWARYVDKRPVTEYGYHVSRDWWYDLLGGLGLGVVLIAINFGIARMSDSLQVTEMASVDGPSLVWLLLFLLGFTCVGFYEEFLYRGLFITNAIEGLSERGSSPSMAAGIALLASTVTFALVHLPSAVAQGGDVTVVAAKTGLLGGLLGVAYLLTDELALPMGLHLGVNYAQMNLFGIGAAGVAGIPTVITVEQTASGFWDPAHGAPLLGAALIGYGLVALWVNWRQYASGIFRATRKTRTDPDQ